ncbi:MAG: hypothetical protein HY314_09605, partial [Acidobacteria bacterium]|nr:hypothetical protein [Acidobacteriota bacterium]
LTLEAGGSPGLFTGTGSSELNRYLTLLNSPNLPSASGLKAGGILVSDSYAYADPGKNDLVVKGNAGLGTTPFFSSTKLSIAGQDAIYISGFQPFLTLEDANTFPDSKHRIQSANNYLVFHHSGGCLTPPCPFTIPMVLNPDGNLGIGTVTPVHRLSIAGGPTWTANGWKGAVELENAAAIAWRANAGGKRFGIGQTGGGLYFFHTASDPGSTGSPANYDMIINDSGIVSMNVLQIQGGADLSEHFDVRSEHIPTVEPGLVVSIDLENPGKLIVSSHAYDRRVAGIVSGAGGVKPGMLMGQAGSIADGGHPVALTGRVYCWADASSGPIEPGDLLTTSDTPGHAMKVADHAQAQGAIIGKAMTSLKEGKGLVLVLVTLQ